MLETIKSVIPEIHKEGYIFIIIFGLVTFLLYFISSFLGGIGLILTLFCMFFFRDPVRVTPNLENFIISPADGIVQEIKIVKPPKELKTLDPEVKRISIFLNVFDVHVNRVPISGKVKELVYNPGKFFNASLDKASEFNERQSIVIEHEKTKINVGVVQIAGLIARRIVCDLEDEQEVIAGEKFGIIRFGSRVDIYVPTHIEPMVLQGQRMLGGETVIANLSGKQVKLEAIKDSNA